MNREFTQLEIDLINRLKQTYAAMKMADGVIFEHADGSVCSGYNLARDMARETLVDIGVKLK